MQQLLARYKPIQSYEQLHVIYVADGKICAVDLKATSLHKSSQHVQASLAC